MSVIKQYSTNNTIKLIVNSLATPHRVDKFIANIKDGYSYEISFVNMKLLPLKVLLKLEEIKDNLVLDVSEPKLKYYLLNLGFHMRSKTIEPKTFEQSIREIKYIAIGGSAGSLEKFIEIIKYLPASNLTFFIIMHQRSDMDSKLQAILNKYTTVYKVEDAKNDQKVKPSTIYIAPNNKHMIVLNDYIFLSDDEPKHFSKPSISISFESLANEYKDQFMAIVVCGYGKDGSDALEVVKHFGGVVLVEKFDECKATAMLESAVETKNYDKILSLNDISLLLYDKIKQEKSLDIHLTQFLQNIYDRYGYDYRDYHKQHILRRIEYSYKTLNVKSFNQFQEMVLKDKVIFENLFLDISVNVTTFFRNPDVYEELKRYLKEHFKNKESIKVWCAGCSSGEEPYSVAILLHELGLWERSLIYATDINDIVLQFAKNGAYSNKSYKLFKEYYYKANNNQDFDSYFNHYDNFVTIKDIFKKRILFFKHNLVTDGVLNEFQLIICRNVLIYFNKDLTIKVFDLFDRSLQDGGVLLLGESETFYYNKKNYQPIDKSKKIFIKNELQDG